MGILKYCLRGLLGDTQRETLFCLTDALTEVLSTQIVRADLCQIEQQLHLALARMERDFPVSVQVLFVRLQSKISIVTLHAHPAFSP